MLYAEKVVPYPTEACFLFGLCEYVKRKHKLYQEESSPAAAIKAKQPCKHSH